jgi:hypothetical protein
VDVLCPPAAITTVTAASASETLGMNVNFRASANDCAAVTAAHVAPEPASLLT